ncbi:MAG: type II toxin-antitoxin system Phd/YefM family antitoxin [Verrucomicrobia bacterium]|nr:type II toxin-antitoxin system Phd/YefM family antitoxin [Verrucomicrobiota bacterium]
MKKWQLQDAKNQFSKVAEDAATCGAQVVTKHGKDAVVILSIGEYEKLVKPKESLREFLRRSPLSGTALDLKRDQSAGREAGL